MPVYEKGSMLEQKQCVWENWREICWMVQMMNVKMVEVLENMRVAH